MQRHADEHEPAPKHIKMTDYGESGVHKEHLKAALGDFVKKVKSGEIEKGLMLLVEKLDRLSRYDYQDAWDWLKAVVKAGITVITLEPEQTLDKKSIKDFGVMISVCAAFMAAEDESKKKSERLKHAWDLRTPAKVRSVSQ